MAYNRREPKHFVHQKIFLPFFLHVFAYKNQGKKKYRETKREGKQLRQIQNVCPPGLGNTYCHHNRACKIGVLRTRGKRKPSAIMYFTTEVPGINNCLLNCVLQS